MRLTHLFAVIVALAVGCVMVGCEGSDGERSSDQPAHYKVSLPPGSTLADAVLLLQPSGADEFKARVVYSGHESQVVVPTDLGGTEGVVRAERDRLRFLSEQFSPNNALESVVRDQFERDIVNLDASGTVTVSWVEYVGLSIKGSILASEVASRSELTSKEVGVVKQAITDWPNDQSFTPAGGTSTVYTTGTLQKFWLDAASAGTIDYVEDGLEIDTVIKPKSAATCNTAGVSSNLPNYYADTEFLDSPSSRNCSVGTVSGISLQIGVLYWTWHPFSSFSTSAHVDVQYQAKSWCFWISTFQQCNNDRPVCMCEHSMYPETSWLVSYNYSEAPGIETSWIKN